MFAKWIEEDGRFAFDLTDNGGIEISDDDHAALFDSQSGTKIIGRGTDGRPQLQDPPLPTRAELSLVERAWRNSQLSMTDGVVTRHRDELEDGAETTLSAEQYIELQAYRRSLRNWPEAGDFPLLEHRPIAPSWLPEQPQ
ncbi:phage tail assembly chaperone [Pseudomonas sp. SJZ085]|uniref:phage tail protein n=1 Tax=unclassified Pseudomonas TaxID=196821 RepID=UPI00119AE476|nr:MULTISPECIES: phage tail protein [unclassified Pseudomonas]TWC11014.1 phage tail assembly chaperone [Pseudomonas sp. SJZ074]TWC29392.1 phage tail assembly chaperone [Pseudomonas sp. SJZ085]